MQSCTAQCAKYKRIQNTNLCCCCDSRSYCVRRTVYSYRPLAENSRGQHGYLLIYSFKRKSAFDAGNLLLMSASCLAVRCVLWLNDISYSRSALSEDVNIGSVALGTQRHNFQHLHRTPTPTLSASMHSTTDRRTDRRADRRKVCCQ